VLAHHMVGLGWVFSGGLGRVYHDRRAIFNIIDWNIRLKDEPLCPIFTEIS
jgi:hypothetical protein